MVIYCLMFFLCTALAFYSERKRRVVVLDSGENVTKPNLFFVILSSFPLIFFTGMRGWIADTGAYIRGFENTDTEYIKDVLRNIGDNKDVGFKVFTYIIKVIFNDYTVWLFIIAIFCAFCLWRTFYKYSDSITYSVYLFFGTTSFSWLFNGMRQYIAVCGMFAMFPLLIKTGNEKKDIRNLIIFIAGTLIFGTIHMTAIVFLPLFLLCRSGDILSRMQMLFILFVVAGCAFVGPFTSFIEGIFSDTQYANIGSDFEIYQGASIFRLAVAAVPAFLGLYRIKYARQLGDKMFNFCYNMSLMNVCLMVPTVVISGNTFGRLAEYAGTFNMLVYPMVTHRLYPDRTRRIINTVVVFMYAFWFYYQMKLSWDWGYTSPYLGTFK